MLDNNHYHTPPERETLDNPKARRKRARMNEELLTAARSGQLLRVKDLLEQGADVDCVSSAGWSPLMEAVWHSQRKVAKALIQAGADLHWEDDDGDTVLHTAVGIHVGWDDEVDQQAIVAMLIRTGADVNRKADDGRTPLHHAARPGAAQQLISSGADVNCLDNTDATPLHQAYGYQGHLVAECLILAGADVNARNGKRQTPLGSRKALAEDGMTEQYQNYIAVLESYSAPE
jgi:ankyrin repeat protein